MVFEYKREVKCGPIVSNWTVFVYKATAEQIRLAQMIYDKNDADFEDKVKQVMCIYTYLDKVIFWVTSKSCWIHQQCDPYCI